MFNSLMKFTKDGIFRYRTESAFYARKVKILDLMTKISHFMNKYASLLAMTMSDKDKYASLSNTCHQYANDYKQQLLTEFEEYLKLLEQSAPSSPESVLASRSADFKKFYASANKSFSALTELARVTGNKQI